MEYQIGDFSKISRLSIKTLRYYHECGLLIPGRIDKINGYRFYTEKDIEKSKIILNLKNLDFSLNEIKEILSGSKEDSDLIQIIKDKENEIKAKINKYKDIEKKLNDLIIKEEKINSANLSNEIIIKNLDEILIASIRFRGKYNEVGKYFGILGKDCHSFMINSFFTLYYELEYKEDDADIEACTEVKQEIDFDSVKSRILSGGKAACLIHQGPYDTIGISYKKLFDYFSKNNYKILIPGRELYLKGPGIIFRGNPNNYLTEIQLLIE